MDEVDSIVKKYKTSRFDCYTDYSYNESSPFNMVYGGADYVFTNRHYSDETIALAIKSLIEKYGESYEFDTALMTVENYHQGKLYKIGREQIIGNESIGGEINGVLIKKTRQKARFSFNTKPHALLNIEPDYNDKKKKVKALNLFILFNIEINVIHLKRVLIYSLFLKLCFNPAL